MKFKNLNMDYARSITFGFEDALVSTTGVVVGIAVGTAQRDVIILAGIVTIAVEALSMGAGQYLSERTVHQMDVNHTHTDSLYLGAIFMFLAYMIGGMVPLFPMFVMPFPSAIYATVISAFIGLFLLGYVKGAIIGVPKLKSALEIFVVGGMATILGLVVGLLLKI
ncbi:hypothetical protein HGA91_03380 [candidate division WWE3 bacterium]|nr:hypothetical protein [candidate division WWE3 bacterium]